MVGVGGGLDMKSGSSEGESVAEEDCSEGMSLLVVGAEVADGKRVGKGHGEFGAAGGLGDLDGLLLRRKRGDGEVDVVAGGGVEQRRLEDLSVSGWIC